MYNLGQIAEITGVTLLGNAHIRAIQVLTDSRNVQTPEGVLFVAIKTARNNGHRFIHDLIRRGVKAFLIQEGEFNPAGYLDKATFLVSPNPLQTLQNLAAYHRQQFNIPVIGITGSNGKTVVKEWLYQLLKKKHSICRSPKSYNSQLGVPLSVLNLNASHTLAIFEAGISQPGEMERLASIIRPTLGVFTALGSAHDEGFESRAQKITEKMALFSGCDTIVANGLELSGNPGSSVKSIWLGQPDSEADITYAMQNGKLVLRSEKGHHEIDFPYTDAASVMNAATCFAVCAELGLSAQELVQDIPKLQPVALRLEIKNAINNALVIHDYYNSDLDSLKIALNYLHQQNRRQRKVLVLSDIEQSGIPEQTLYRQVAELLQQNKIDFLIGIGVGISRQKPLFAADALFYTDTKSFGAHLPHIAHQLANSTILLKGARSFGFEYIGHLLQQKSHDTVFEINLDKLTDNVNYYRNLLAQDVQLMCMVKAMGYGSGGAEIARTLQHIGVNYLAVAYADEGVELRQSQITLPVMVMNPEEDAFDDIVNYNLEPEIYSFGVLQSFLNKLDALGLSQPYPVHLKIDTGMHRLGFEVKDIERLMAVLKTSPQIRVRSLFSHLAASDNSDLDSFTAQQIVAFEKAATSIEQALGYSTIKHICNSGAITRHPQAHFNMVRLGIGMYGIGVNGAEQQKLHNVGSLKTRISQIKEVDAGETVSYNRSGKILQKTRIATLPLGYADGFSRALGNGNHGVYIHGVFCPTVGNVCMDMCMVDVSKVDCQEGDQVVIFETATQIYELANALKSIPYEVLTSVSGRVKRVYVKE